MLSRAGASKSREMTIDGTFQIATVRCASAVHNARARNCGAELRETAICCALAVTSKSRGRPSANDAAMRKIRFHTGDRDFSRQPLFANALMHHRSLAASKAVQAVAGSRAIAIRNLWSKSKAPKPTPTAARPTVSTTACTGIRGSSPVP